MSSVAFTPMTEGGEDNDTDIVLDRLLHRM